MKFIEQTQAKVDKMIDEYNKETVTLQDQLEQEAEEIRQAKAAMAEASDNNDLAAYQKAKGQLRDLQDLREMHSAKLEKMEDETLIGSDEYTQMINDITADMNKDMEAVKLQLKEASDQMGAIAARIRDELQQVNTLLQLAQHELYKDKDRHVSDKGFFQDSPKEYKGEAFDLIGWGEAGVNHYMYQQFTGKKAN